MQGERNWKEMTRRSRQCLRPRNRKRVRFVGRSQGREGRKAKETRDEIWDEIRWRSRGERERERQRQSFTVWTTLLVFFNF